MTLWLVVAAGTLGDREHGEWFLSEEAAKRCAAGRNGQASYYTGTVKSRVVRAETVEPAGPLFRDEAAALLASSGDGTAQ